jgi:uncharacterized membrane protein YdbT with pleckstrin-like domain
VAFGLLLLGAGLFSAVMLPLWTTEIGVTNQRFIFKRGLIWRSTHELQLRAIEEVNLEQDLLGRIFDCGRLRLHGTGVDDIRLPVLADPIGLRKALQDGMAAANQANPAATRVATARARPRQPSKRCWPSPEPRIRRKRPQVPRSGTRASAAMKSS